MEFATIYFNECSQIRYATVQLVRNHLAQVVPGLRQQAYYDINPTGIGHWTNQEHVAETTRRTYDQHMYTFRNGEWDWPPKRSRKSRRHEASTIRLTATVVRSRPTKPSLGTRIANAYVSCLVFIVKFVLGLVLSFLVIGSIWLMVVIIRA